MNKIVLGNDDIFDNIVIQDDTDIILKLNDISSNINIIVDDNVCVNLIELSCNTNNKIICSLKDNSKLIYNRAVKDSNDDILINLDGISSSVIMNNSVLSKKESINKINIEHNNILTSSNLSNHGINDSKFDFVFDVNAIIRSFAKSSRTKQENRIININCGKSNIYPNLIVDIDEVDAAHSAYISDFDKDNLFYMKSRGISESESRKILLKTFLVGNLEGVNEYINDIEEIFRF